MVYVKSCFLSCPGAGSVVPELDTSVKLHFQSAGPPCKVVGETGYSTHQELLLSSTADRYLTVCDRLVADIAFQPLL